MLIKGVVQSREYELRRSITKTDSQTSELAECQGYFPSSAMTREQLFLIWNNPCNAMSNDPMRGLSLSVKSKYLTPYLGADH